MTTPGFVGRWIIHSSTSRLFPPHSKIELILKKPESAGFELYLSSEEHAKLKLIDEDFLPENGALKGRFRHPKDKPEPEDLQEDLQIVVTLCPATFEDGKRRLFGLLRSAGGRIEPGSTGVWVAEEQQPPRPPKQ